MSTFVLQNASSSGINKSMIPNGSQFSNIYATEGTIEEGNFVKLDSMNLSFTEVNKNIITDTTTGLYPTGYCLLADGIIFCYYIEQATTTFRYWIFKLDRLCQRTDIESNEITNQTINNSNIKSWRDCCDSDENGNIFIGLTNVSTYSVELLHLNYDAESYNDVTFVNHYTLDTYPTGTRHITMANINYIKHNCIGYTWFRSYNSNTTEGNWITKLYAYTNSTVNTTPLFEQTDVRSQQRAMYIKSFVEENFYFTAVSGIASGRGDQMRVLRVDPGPVAVLLGSIVTGGSGNNVQCIYKSGDHVFSVWYRQTYTGTKDHAYLRQYLIEGDVCTQPFYEAGSYNDDTPSYDRICIPTANGMIYVFCGNMYIKVAYNQSTGTYQKSDSEIIDTDGKYYTYGATNTQGHRMLNIYPGSYFIYPTEDASVDCHTGFLNTGYSVSKSDSKLGLINGILVSDVSEQTSGELIGIEIEQVTH